MKTSISMLFFLLFSLNVFSQNIVIPKDTTFVAKATEFSYKVSLFSKVNRISVETTETVFPPNEYDWKGACKVLDYGERPSRVLKRHLQPYLKRVEDKEDEYIRLIQEWDLDGNLQYIRISYPVSLPLPLTVIEEMEKDMRVNCKRKITEIKDKKHINHIDFYMEVTFYSLLNSNEPAEWL